MIASPARLPRHRHRQPQKRPRAPRSIPLTFEPVSDRIAGKPPPRREPVHRRRHRHREAGRHPRPQQVPRQPAQVRVRRLEHTRVHELAKRLERRVRRHPRAHRPRIVQDRGVRTRARSRARARARSRATTGSATATTRCTEGTRGDARPPPGSPRATPPPEARAAASPSAPQEASRPAARASPATGRMG